MYQKEKKNFSFSFYFLLLCDIIAIAHYLMKHQVYICTCTETLCLVLTIMDLHPSVRPSTYMCPSIHLYACMYLYLYPCAWNFLYLIHMNLEYMYIYIYSVFVDLQVCLCFHLPHFVFVQLLNSMSLFILMLSFLHAAPPL